MSLNSGLFSFSFLCAVIPHVRPTRRRLLSVSVALLIGGSLLMPSVQPPVRAQAGVPTLLSPADGTTATVDNCPPLGIPEFTWASVASATRYRIQFSQDVGFATIRLEVTTPNTSYTPISANIFSDGTWYWRVRVDAPEPSDYQTPPWSFTKQWASPGNAPTLDSPAAGATLAFYDKPVFSWQHVTGGASYRLEIDSSQDFVSPLDYSQTTLAPSHQPKAKLANGTYYWRVIPLDPAGRDGTSSEVRSFTIEYDEVPTLLGPADDSRPIFTPTFRWAAVRGAQFYRLQYSTDPTFATDVNQVDTRNTTYAPLNALPNDVNYYWRVRAHSGASVSDWSATWLFLKQWYTQTVLLTPVNLYQYVENPLFGWTPVPGARKYKIEVSPVNSFPPVGGGFTNETANTLFVRTQPQSWYDNVWYWRVTPMDNNNNEGLPSPVSSFVYSPTAGAPQLIYPLYYYSYEDPNLQHLQTLQPREDRTVAVPIFMWHRLLTFLSAPNDQRAAYRVEVDDDPLFWSPNWTFDTENLSAVPTAANPFTPTAGTDYYWRVRPLDGLGGAEIGQWSQRWRTRIDTTRGLTSTSSLTPTLLRPVHGSEFVEAAPLLEWWPLQGADFYEVQISTDLENFGSYITDTATVPYPAYIPQRRLYYGTYYWRVRGHSGGSPLGDWSTPWRFQVAAQSRWRQTRTLGDSSNRSLIGSDPAGDMTDPNYDLTTLHAVQAMDDWFFGFHAITDTTTDMTYALYLDLDHKDGSGAISDARGYNVATISAHRLEYAIYVRQSGGSFSAGDAIIYSWTGTGWGIPNDLTSIGGALYYSPTANYLEIQVPNTAIGMEEETGSAAVSLFSAMDTGHAQDTVPSDPNVGYTSPDSGAETTTLSRFASVSDRLNLAMPPNNATGDPTTFPSVPPLFWHKPVDAPWFGYSIEVALDEEFTSPLLDYTIHGLSCRLPCHADDEDFEGDNTYYWRVRPVYVPNPLIKGAWSEPGRFDRLGFIPQNMQTSVGFATPTFSWDMVEGAKDYTVEVDEDPGFGSPVLQRTTAQNSYTYDRTLGQGTYYWRVRANRHSNIRNEWTYTQTFTLNLPQPTGLSHDPPGAVIRAPTLCWTPVVTPTSSPVIAAWKHRVEVSQGDPTFSTIYDSVETEQACWTPTKGYGDLTNYYWRVAMIDGDGKLGNYSEPITCTKQYPVTTLISPTSGSMLATTPTFVWTPVDGAASYKLEVSLLANFGTIYDQATTNNTRYTPNKEYDIGETYYWRVAIIDKNNNYGPFNTATIVLDPYPYSIYLPLVVRS